MTVTFSAQRRSGNRAKSEERSKNGYANTHVYSALILLEYVIFYLLEYAILKAGIHIRRKIRKMRN